MLSDGVHDIHEFVLESRKRDFHKFIKETFPDFVDGWVYEDLCNTLMQFMRDVREKKSPRVIICLPPRMGKSQISTVRFAIFCMLNNPKWEVIIASYGQNIANRFSRFARELIQHHPYIRKMWPHINLSDDNAAVEEWRIKEDKKHTFTSGGTYKAVGKGGPITGSGADVFIFDDLIKDAEEADSQLVRTAIWEWYQSTAKTRLSPGGGMIVVQTRWHPDDLIGRLLSEENTNEDADKWTLHEYKALAEQDENNRKLGESLLPARWPTREFEKIKNNLSLRWWEALYQQNPINKGGNLFKESAFRYYLAAPEPKEFDSIIQVWDLRFGKSQAKTSSWVVGWVVGKKGGQFYILDEARGRWSYAESKQQLEALTARWPDAITKLVENKANGPALESDMESQIPGILLHNPKGDKFQRAERILSLVLAGNVFFPDKVVAPWSKEAVEELCAFPRGSADDRVDVLSMALGWFVDRDSEMCEVFALPQMRR